MNWLFIVHCFTGLGIIGTFGSLQAVWMYDHPSWKREREVCGWILTASLFMAVICGLMGELVIRPLGI